MNELEAKVERARLQALLDAYEADRQHQRREGGRMFGVADVSVGNTKGLTRISTPRFDN